MRSLFKIRFYFSLICRKLFNIFFRLIYLTSTISIWLLACKMYAQIAAAGSFNEAAYIGRRVEDQNEWLWIIFTYKSDDRPDKRNHNILLVCIWTTPKYVVSGNLDCLDNAAELTHSGLGISMTLRLPFWNLTVGASCLRLSCCAMCFGEINQSNAMLWI